MFEEPSDPTPCAYGRCLPLTAFLGGVGFSPTFNTASVKSQTRKKYLGICLALWTAAREFRIVGGSRPREVGKRNRATRQPSPLLSSCSRLCRPSIYSVTYLSLSLSLDITHRFLKKSNHPDFTQKRNRSGYFFFSFFSSSSTPLFRCGHCKSW